MFLGHTDQVQSWAQLLIDQKPRPDALGAKIIGLAKAGIALTLAGRVARVEALSECAGQVGQEITSIERHAVGWLNLFTAYRAAQRQSAAAFFSKRQ